MAVASSSSSSSSSCSGSPSSMQMRFQCSKARLKGSAGKKHFGKQDQEAGEKGRFCDGSTAVFCCKNKNYNH